MDVKDIIRQRREELNLTYEQLGNMVGVGKSTVRKWETGMIENMRRDNIVALAKALNISPAIIMGWDALEEISSNDVINLSKDEKTLLDNYNQLNDLGKKEANKRVAELTEINAYRDVKEITHIGMAAHNDFADDEEQQRLMKEDLDEL